MKRIAFFAHYDRDGVIDDHVIYYLRGLQKVSSRILFASNCKLALGEAAKLDGIAELVHDGRHDEYDFGSWKRCFKSLDYNLDAWDEVIIANDSCYAPLWPLDDLFNKMQAVSCDFWAPTGFTAGGDRDHLSAYFMIFRCVPGMQETLRKFFSAITPEPEHTRRIDLYEIGLSKALWQNGFKGEGCINKPFATLSDRRYILQIPFLKIRIIRDNPTYIVRLGKLLDELNTSYPRALIDAHMLRTIGTSNPAHHNLLLPVRWKYNRFGLSILSKLDRNKHATARYLWWKVYASIFGARFFAFYWPFRNPHASPRSAETV